MRGDDSLIKLKPLVISIAIPLLVGGLSSFISRGGFAGYAAVSQPAFAPPAWLFPIVWTILYILMGISCYMIYVTRHPLRDEALKIYAAQLAVNFLWPILFFVLNGFFISFLWLILLDMLIAAMIMVFFRIKPLSGLLQLPYLTWCIFASVLNFSIWLLNR